MCVLLGGVYKYAIGTGVRLDLFLFYDHPKGGRLLSNILKDSADMLTLTTVFLLWYINSNAGTRKVLLPFLIITFVDIADYFLFYKQMSVYKLPLLIVLIIIFNLKCQFKKQ